MSMCGFIPDFRTASGSLSTGSLADMAYFLGCISKLKEELLGRKKLRK